MGETLLLTTIITLIVLAIRRSKPVILDNPVVMHRPGKYHITLAPQLNRAQAFIENIATQIGDAQQILADSVTQYFCVFDEKVFSKGEKFYLLALSARGGMIYFQAIKPQPALSDKESDYLTLYKFSNSVMLHHHVHGDADKISAQLLHDAVFAVAQQRQVRVEILSES